MMPLSLAPAGSRVRVVDVRGGRGLVRRLAEMGIYPGAVVEVLSNWSGPVVVSVGGVRLGLGPGVAHKVLVEPVWGGV